MNLTQPFFWRNWHLWRMYCLVLMATLSSATGAETNTPEAEVQGHALAQKILAQLAQFPAENSTNTGTLEIRDNDGIRYKTPVEFRIIVEDGRWLSVYSAQTTNAATAQTSHKSVIRVLTVIHAPGQPDTYLLPPNRSATADAEPAGHPTSSQLMVPFAGSDFWLCDLALEFFHWPEQRIMKKEFHRNCPCTVLESINPNAPSDGYFRVVCWIDDESLGIVEAYAYNSAGKKLKSFYPKSLEKVKGRYQLRSMVMENTATGSRSKLEFDLDK